VVAAGDAEDDLAAAVDDRVGDDLGGQQLRDPEL
jgi:hypothetical protein